MNADKILLGLIVVIYMHQLNAINDDALVRHKRGIGKFFVRFFTGRKKNQQTKGLYPADKSNMFYGPNSGSSSNFGPDYLYSQASQLYPSMYQYYPQGMQGNNNPGISNYPQQPYHMPQEENAYVGFNRQPYTDYHQHHQHHNHEEPQQPGQQYYNNQQQQFHQQDQSSSSNPQYSMNQMNYANTNNNNNNINNNNENVEAQAQPSFAYGAQGANIQQEESANRPLVHGYGKPEMNYGGQQGSYDTNVAQASTFQARPYGSVPDTIDVHKVLDSFIRSAGLSPQGDHENIKNDHAYAESGTKPVFSLKKLYSYPFYFTSAGEKTTGTKDAYSRRQSNNDKEVNVPSSFPTETLQPMASRREGNDAKQSDTAFINRNADLLTEYLNDNLSKDETSKATNVDSAVKSQ